MIYFYYGNDADKARKKTSELIDQLRNKRPDASFFKIDSDNFNIELIKEYIGGQGLFSAKYIIFLDKICEYKENKDLFLDLIKDISKSENIFIILENKLDKATATKIEKNSAKYIKFDLIDRPIKSEYNAFALADAFANKDKKQTWILYRQAIDNGESVEALHGMVFWKVKTLILNSNSNWNKNDLYNILDELISIYHNSRRGLHDLETKFESFILN